MGRKTRRSDRLHPAQRQRFVGTWEGRYGLTEEQSVDDVIEIARGARGTEVIITIHAAFMNPDQVRGRLVSSKVIEVPEQSMGGSPGTAQLIMTAPGELSYVQRGLGLEARGVYRKR